ncbi:hypothetical protein [Endozoicomonas sp.]|uniref:hypothetical protein n=1 Tax=Endozoicomonas sp. TaxID=1892382 RepID=UPI003AF82D2E
MKTLKTLALATAVSAGLLGSGAIAAATPGVDGLLGATSEGSFDINLDIKGQIIIKGLESVDFSAPLGKGDLIGGTQHCVSTNSVGGKYAITASSDNADGNKFRLMSPDAADFVEYNVYYSVGKLATSTIPGSKATLKSGETNDNGAAGFVSNDSTLACNDDNATVFVEIPEANVKTATSQIGAWTDTLTLLVAPI